jgi:molecular chaperone GrpE (heat shock protein)
MINKMKIDQKILNEINRYHTINRYITEQDAPPPPPPLGDPMADPNAAPMPNAPMTPPGEVSPIPPGGGEDPLSAANPQPIDVETDDDVTVIDDEGDSKEGDEDSEELDITDLVSSQKNMETKQNEYFDNLFAQIDKLEQKLATMDGIFDKLNAIDSKVEKYREKTPEEKLELRTYDSYPFNQKLSQFFDDKQVEMEKSGKNDYVLTTDDVTNINPNEIKDTFYTSSNDEDDYTDEQNYKAKF